METKKRNNRYIINCNRSPQVQENISNTFNDLLPTNSNLRLIHTQKHLYEIVVLAALKLALHGTNYLLYKPHRRIINRFFSFRSSQKCRVFASWVYRIIIELGRKL